MTKEELEVEIEKLKSDYIRIQEDMDKLEFVGGRVSSAEGQLVELEKKIAHLKEKLQSQS
ncbi:MAG TPA: SE1832 family protein [Virgibacillus sp.]|nr:SE1832 family protein [Virgibacillus sp.]